ncbi:CBS domain-containing protein [Peribacillus psychrosaccharolyticus]|uniref:CBS domain-containing protein n=1 Tax=Peribacillus psychrosaccharolyticus TaxID=1407 RepID=UPI0003108A4D|nr:CBS domain-containing protein [Peribacillus psychrosaccharolyticus]
MRVRDFMITDVFTLEENENFKTLLELMVEKRIGGVPVVNTNNQLVGIISDGDVLRTLKPKTHTSYFGYYLSYTDDLDDTLSKAANQSIKQAMRKKVITVNEDDELESVLKLLANNHSKRSRL